MYPLVLLHFAVVLESDREGERERERARERCAKNATTFLPHMCGHKTRLGLQFNM